MLVSTTTLGGHVNTTEPNASPSRRRRFARSDEFKADAVAAAQQPGMSMAAVALAKGVNANLLRRWVREAEVQAPVAPKTTQPWIPARPAFVQVPVPTPVPAPSGGDGGDIRLQLQRGPTTITVTWPVAAAGECAHWMRELLR